MIKGVFVDLLINKDILQIFIEELDTKFIKEYVEKGQLSIKYLIKNTKISLAVANNFISVGLFKKDGSFDQNRLIISEEKNAILWGNLLFEKHNKESLFLKID